MLLGIKSSVNFSQRVHRRGSICISQFLELYTKQCCLKINNSGRALRCYMITTGGSIHSDHYRDSTMFESFVNILIQGTVAAVPNELQGNYAKCRSWYKMQTGAGGWKGGKKKKLWLFIIMCLTYCSDPIKVCCVGDVLIGVCRTL